MAKRRIAQRSRPRWYRSHRRGKKTIPILPILGGVMGIFVPAAGGDSAYVYMQRGYWNDALVALGKNYMGFDANTGKFDVQMAMRGALPLVAGLLAHKALNMLGAGKLFSGLPSPLNRIRL